MGDFFPSLDDYEKDYSLRQLWHMIRGFPAVAMLGVTSLASEGARMPDDWELSALEYQSPHGSRQAKVLKIPAKEPRGVVGFMPGWKTSALDKMEAIEDIRNSGYSVVSVGLANPGLETGSLADSLQRIKSFAFDGNSPLYTGFAEELPRFVVTHSTSGMLFQHALIDARYQDGILPPIKHAFHTAPFFDTSGSSKDFHPVSNWLYTRHAKRHFNELAGTPLMDRLYYYIRGISRMLEEEDPFVRPTHGQILEISQYGSSYFKRKEQELVSGGAAATLPQTFVISTDDSFSCPRTAQKAAELERAEIRLCKARHNPLLVPPVRRSIIERLVDLTVPPEFADYLNDLLPETDNGDPVGVGAGTGLSDDGDQPQYQFT
ncbi:MAG: hypothetical protein KDI90_03210 [Alphaproteobacteria bacterium]|nr:hypothetical protein [Alphaproteobacteria bacterium]